MLIKYGIKDLSKDTELVQAHGLESHATTWIYIYIGVYIYIFICIYIYMYIYICILYNICIYVFRCLGKFELIWGVATANGIMYRFFFFFFFFFFIFIFFLQRVKRSHLGGTTSKPTSWCLGGPVLKSGFGLLFPADDSLGLQRGTSSLDCGLETFLGPLRFRRFHAPV